MHHLPFVRQLLCGRGRQIEHDSTTTAPCVEHEKQTAGCRRAVAHLIAGRPDLKHVGIDFL